MSKYEVVKWWKDEENNSGSCNTKWLGEEIDQALIVASYLFAREIVAVKCMEEELLDPYTQEVDFSYADKVSCRIIVLEVISPMDEARGKIPPVLKSFGNESIKIFQRWHLD